MNLFIENTFDLEIKIEKKVQTVEHTFSHLVWNISVYQATVIRGEIKGDRLRWVNHNTIEHYPFPVSHQKIIEQIYK